ncbi:MAG TPA: hypothetical protein DHW61_16105 [Lachnoclostridium phytofermentans]|uniref:Uncharacterized protein n=1 Tax=Lachnoclostridium phytofermentans TaxID=66219 RepID=A0A3D2XAD4_9FIRM|nr:hypothetical protein [Lachnoclostridium phytofermentans]
MFSSLTNGATPYFIIPVVIKIYNGYEVKLTKPLHRIQWHAVVPMNSVADRIEEERGFLREALADTPQKGQALINY